MAKVALASVLLLSLSLLVLCQPSPPPTPTPSKSTQQQEQQRNHEADESDRPQSTNPTVIGIANSAPQNQKAESDKKTSPDWWIISLTGALVLLAGAQFWAMHRQAEYMRKGIRISIRQTRASFRGAAAAKQAANAAELSADSAKRSLDLVVRSELPLLVMELEQTQDRGIAKFHFTNYGRTPAFVVDLRCDYQRVFKADVFAYRDYETVFSSRGDFTKPIRQGESSQTLYRRISGTFGVVSEDDMRWFGEGILVFRLFGIVQYEGVFGDAEPRSTTFCWDLIDRNWHKSGPPEANQCT